MEADEHALWDDTQDLLKLIRKKIFACGFAQQELRIFIKHLLDYHADKITKENVAEIRRGLTRIAFLADCVNADVKNMYTINVKNI